MSYDGRTNYIGGEWRTARSGETFASLNPADREDVIGAFARSRADDVDAAVRAAQDAYKDWRRTPAPARGAILTRMGRLMEERKEELSLQMVREMGKVLTEARGDVQEAIDMAHYMAAFGRLPNGQACRPSVADVFCLAQRVPIGVVGLITPWNFPIAIPSVEDVPGPAGGQHGRLQARRRHAGSGRGFCGTADRSRHTARCRQSGHRVRRGSGRGSGGASRRWRHFVHRLDRYGAADCRSVRAVDEARLVRTWRQERHCCPGRRQPDLAVKGALWSAFGTAGQRCTAASRLIVQRGVKANFGTRWSTRRGR